MLRKLKKKKIFYFGDNIQIGRLYLQLRKNNFFITFTDLQNKVIRCITSALVLGRIDRRRRKAPHIMDILIDFLFKFFELYNLATFEIILKMRVTSHLRHLIDALLSKGFGIFSISVRRNIPYSNGMRGKKLRRI